MAASVPYFEYIVIGCGGIGSAAVYWLSRRAGKGVLGLEQFKLGHVNGGSQDYSRIIRLMYHDDDYTKLAIGSYDAWAEVEKESGIQLVYKTGSLDLAKKGTQGEIEYNMYCAAMDKASIKYEKLSAKALRQRFPQFTCNDDMLCLYQADGGLVDAGMGNATHIQLALAHGATVIDNCPVTRIDTRSDGTAIVHTTQGQFRCRRVIVTAGAWINHVLSSVGVHIPVMVTQEQVTYFATPHIKEFTKERYPVWIHHSDSKDIFFGLPIHGNTGSKIGIDLGGPAVTADTRTFIPDPVREKKCIDFLKENIPRSLGPIMSTKTCLYTVTPDRDFIVDTLARKGKPQIVVCCGAGHAYKFASLLGKILSQLAIDGQTTYGISEFKVDRPAILDPTTARIMDGTAQPTPTAKANL